MTDSEILLTNDRVEVAVQFLADRARNPFDMQPPCERFVPSYGNTDADFHIIGDYPGTHGGLSTGIPFTDEPWSGRFFDALETGGLIVDVDLDAGAVDPGQSFISYLHPCETEWGRPTEESYGDLEPYFDAELRAITAHVLLPVGKRATEHVFREYTAIGAERARDMESLHAADHRGSGWLIVPIKEPADWTDDDEQALVERLRTLLASDYRQISDLGRFTADGDPYFVR